MEKPPELNPAEQPEKESIAEQHVAKLISEKGESHPETLQALTKLVIQKYEKKAEQEGTSRGNIEVAIEIAELYHRLGYFERALEELEGMQEAVESDSTAEDLRPRYYSLLEEFKKDL